MNPTEEQIKEEQRRYYREWRAKNRERVRAINRRYWLKRAAKAAEGEKEDGEA